MKIIFAIVCALFFCNSYGANVCADKFTGALRGWANTGVDMKSLGYLPGVSLDLGIKETLVPDEIVLCTKKTNGKLAYTTVRNPRAHRVTMTYYDTNKALISVMGPNIQASSLVVGIEAGAQQIHDIRVHFGKWANESIHIGQASTGIPSVGISGRYPSGLPADAAIYAQDFFRQGKNDPYLGLVPFDISAFVGSHCAPAYDYSCLYGHEYFPGGVETFLTPKAVIKIFH